MFMNVALRCPFPFFLHGCSVEQQTTNVRLKLIHAQVESCVELYIVMLHASSYLLSLPPVMVIFKASSFEVFERLDDISRCFLSHDLGRYQYRTC